MKKYTLIFVPAFLLFLSLFATDALAREEERESEVEHGVVSITVKSSNDDHDDDRLEQKKKAADRAKKLKEKQKERQKKLLERLLEARRKKGINTSQSGSTTTTNTGTTNTGSTNTGTTTTTPITKSATVNYNVPGDNVPVKFSVTVNNGTITAASSTTQAGGTSGYYQDAFAQGISNAAVGKKVSGLSLSAVGGASLTTQAFVQYVKSNF